MKRQAEIAPLQTSFALSTQFPCPGGAESAKRGSMRPPRRSSLPPRPPKIPTTRQQIVSQNFNPGPRLSQPVFSFGSLPPMSPAPSAYDNAAVLTRPTTSVSSLSSLMKVHRRAYSDNNSGPQDAVQMIYSNNSKEGPGEKESHGEPASFMDEYYAAYNELDKIYDSSNKNDDDVAKISGDSEIGKSSSGNENKRNAITSGVRKRMRKSVSSSMDCNLDGNSLSIKSPRLPPSPGNALGIEIGMFTASQMKQIACCERLKKLAVSDPKCVKRILYNRESATRTRERTAEHILKLEATIHTLEKETAKVTAQTSSVERTKVALEEENKRIRIRLQELEEKAKHDNELTENYKREINRLKQKGTGEVIQNTSSSSENEGSSNREALMEENIWEQLNLDEEELRTNNYGFGCFENDLKWLPGFE